ncbi:MAG: hypothetical protein FWE67_11910, partial [Planctomycetaceae bacterium]|nr:hypothetical protein [Planctomycetaceae bacterium]
PQITADIQEQLKKELSFYEAKRAVAKLNSEAQQKEDAAALERQPASQNNKIKVFPSAENNAVKMLPPAEENDFAKNKISDTGDKKTVRKTAENDELVPLRRIESVKPAVVNLVPPQNSDSRPKAQLKAVNNPKETPESPKTAAKVPSAPVVQNAPPQEKYEFARIEPQKKVSANPEEEPVLAFRPKNDKSAYKSTDSAPLASVSEPQPEPKLNDFWKEPVASPSEPQQQFAFAIPAAKPAESPAEKPAEMFAANTQPVETKPAETVLSETVLVETPPADVRPIAPLVEEVTDFKYIETAVIPVEKKQPVFEKPVIEPPTETPQVAWAVPVIPIKEEKETPHPKVQPTVQSVKEVAKETPKEQPVKVIAAKEIPKKEIKEKPAEKVVAATPVPVETVKPAETTVMAETKKAAVKFDSPKQKPSEPVLPKPVEHPEVAKSAPPKQEAPKQEEPKQEVVKQEAPKQEEPKQEVAKQEVPKQETKAEAVAASPVIVPPMPVAQSVKRTPSVGMMPVAELSDSFRLIQSYQEQAIPNQPLPMQTQPSETPAQTLAESSVEFPAGFARTKKSVPTPEIDLQRTAFPNVYTAGADKTGNSVFSVSTESSGFARSSSFMQAGVQEQTTAAVTEPPLIRQEFRPLFFWNSQQMQNRNW